MADQNFDLHQLTRKEYNQLRLGELTPDQANAVLARVTGMTADILDAMPLDEFKGLMEAFYAKASRPLADPNSPAPSGTP